MSTNPFFVMINCTKKKKKKQKSNPKSKQSLAYREKILYMHTSTHSRLLSNYKHRDRQTRSLCVSSSLGRNCRPTDPFSCVVRKLQCCRVARHPLNEFQMPVAQNWGNDCEVFQSFNPSCQSFDTGSQRTQNTAHSTRYCKKLCSRKRKLVKFGYFV